MASPDLTAGIADRAIKHLAGQKYQRCLEDGAHDGEKRQCENTELDCRRAARVAHKGAANQSRKHASPR
ncbi:hypothetical protein PSQ19_16645 [Devosia algicola]|uniref:Uncharacterized protein n=1 Tax=Devosia algicola TaxID=3026418 RepID=A0ABY7YMD4_9HYPH|nr:hypothetical protein [Devosia algicola]WDR02245.1 hypothetical protein PSQ19_16645 [Devosia algicola]